MPRTDADVEVDVGLGAQVDVVVGVDRPARRAAGSGELEHVTEVRVVREPLSATLQHVAREQKFRLDPVLLSRRARLVHSELAPACKTTSRHFRLNGPWPVRSNEIYLHAYIKLILVSLSDGQTIVAAGR